MTVRAVVDDEVGDDADPAIAGLPQKSFVRPSGEADGDVVWELVSDSDDYEYRQAGIPGADYS